MLKKFTALILILLILFSCTTKQQSPERKYVSEASYFDKPKSISNLPENLLTAFSKNRIIFIGETHYIEEHVLMLSLIIKSAYEEGYRYLLIEDMDANSYIYDLYVKDESFILDDLILGLHKDILLEVRNINAELKKNNKAMISISCFDLNHKDDVFKNAVITILNLNEIEDINLLESSQTLEHSSSNYEEILRNYLNVLSLYKNTINTEVVNTLIEMTKFELKTLEYKKNYSWEFREEAMFEQISNKIEQLRPNDKIIINCGLWHAQKKNQWNLGIEGLQVIGEKMQNKYGSEELYHILTLGLKGEFKDNWADSETFQFDFVKNSKEENLMKLIGEKDSSRYAFLDFKYAPINERIIFGFYRDTIEIEPKVVFDGLLVYPEMNVSNASKEYKNSMMNIDRGE